MAIEKSKNRLHTGLNQQHSKSEMSHEVTKNESPVFQSNILWTFLKMWDQKETTSLQSLSLVGRVKRIHMCIIPEQGGY
jgi:hypothetical protein